MTARDTVVILGVVALQLQVVCDEAVGVGSAAQIGLSGGAHTGIEFPTTYVVNGPRQFTLTYANNVAAGDVIYFPFHDPAVRTTSGGFMATIAAGSVVV